LREAEASRLRPDTAESVHLETEAMKKAFALCHAHVADPDAMRVTADSLLDAAFLAEAAAELSASRAAHHGPPPPPDHGTVYVAAADPQGRMVSFIQSNYLGFGSGIVVAGTGISLQNRGLGFSLDPTHPNVVDGHKRPYHTIMPGFLTRHGQPLLSFGVMGGHMQPQGHVQLVRRIVDQGLNPQAACDAPRWHVREDDAVGLEAGFPASVRRGLAKRGHALMSAPAEILFGGAQAIWRLPDGYCAASDPRKDGQAVGL
jgi:gamma-glutamyltranspeptidase/glutathione hydrolase